MRFYQRKTFSEVAAAIGSSEDAARKRVSRAIERLRSLLARRGVTMAPALLATIIWEQAAGAAPASLISAAQTILIHPAVQSANLAKGTILMLNVQKAKVAAVAFVIILAAGLLGIALVDRATGQVEHPHAAAAQRPEAASPASKEFKVIQITPILNVQDLEASLDFYVNKLGFEKQFEHGDPPTFASVARDGLAIFLAQGEQGQPGTWIYIAVSEVDTLHQDISARGAEIAQPPEDRPWGMREMLIEDPDAHQIRIGSMMPHHAPPEKK